MPDEMIDDAVKICQFQQRLNDLRAEIEAAGFKVCAFWTGEYGGMESCILGIADGINVVESKSK
jgi:hypothetical protein